MLKGNIKDESSRTVWAEFKPGFEVQIRFITRAHAERIVTAARSKQWNPGAAAFLEMADDAKYCEIAGREMIVGWRGLTPDVLRTMVDMESYPNAEVPYSPEDAAELLDKADIFEGWVKGIARNLEYFQAARRAEQPRGE